MGILHTLNEVIVMDAIINKVMNERCSKILFKFKNNDKSLFLKNNSETELK